MSLRWFFAVFLFASVAFADDLPVPDPCSVPTRCSSAGIECIAGDRNCEEQARASGLEVICEKGSGAAKSFVYCPPDSAQRDSRVMWIMLGAAVAVAVVGGAILFFAIRKKPA